MLGSDCIMKGYLGNISLDNSTLNQFIAKQMYRAISLTQSEYDSLSEYDDNKLYLITDVSDDEFHVTSDAIGHNSVFRGKSLGNQITEEQWAQIKSGTFENMYVGDYWELPWTYSGGVTDNVKFRIAGFDHHSAYYTTPSSYTETVNVYHTVVLVPDSCLGKIDCLKMVGPYYGSEVQKYLEKMTKQGDKETLYDSIDNNHYLWIYDQFCTQMDDHIESVYSSYSVKGCVLMTQLQLFGQVMRYSGGSMYHSDTQFNLQFPLFRLAPQYMVAQPSKYFSNPQGYWLRECGGSKDSNYYVDRGRTVNEVSAGVADVGIRPAIFLW